VRSLNAIARQVDKLERDMPPTNPLAHLSDDELRQHIERLEAAIREQYGDGAVDEDPALRELNEHIERLERDAKGRQVPDVPK
jgi:hypothetical protein